MSFNTLSPELNTAVALHAINNITPVKLHQLFEDYITRTHTQASSMEKVLHFLDGTVGLDIKHSLAAQKEERLKHCARCHESYMEIENGLTKCAVKHSKAVLVNYINENGVALGLMNVLYCCGKVFRPSDILPQTPCIQARHTTLARNVEEQYKRENVPRCSPALNKGCPIAAAGSQNVAPPVVNPAQAQADVPMGNHHQPVLHRRKSTIGGDVVMDGSRAASTSSSAQPRNDPRMAASQQQAIAQQQQHLRQQYVYAQQASQRRASGSSVNPPPGYTAAAGYCLNGAGPSASR